MGWQFIITLVKPKQFVGIPNRCFVFLGNGNHEFNLLNHKTKKSSPFSTRWAPTSYKCITTTPLSRGVVITPRESMYFRPFIGISYFTLLMTIGNWGPPCFWEVQPIDFFDRRTARWWRPVPSKKRRLKIEQRFLPNELKTKTPSPWTRGGLLVGWLGVVGWFWRKVRSLKTFLFLPFEET